MLSRTVEICPKITNGDKSCTLGTLYLLFFLPHLPLDRASFAEMASPPNVAEKACAKFTREDTPAVEQAYATQTRGKLKRQLRTDMLR